MNLAKHVHHNHIISVSSGSRYVKTEGSQELLGTEVSKEPCCDLRIDTSGEGVNWSANLNKVWISCSL